MDDHERIQELDHELNSHSVLWKLIVNDLKKKRFLKEGENSYSTSKKVSEPNWVGIVPLNEFFLLPLFWFSKTIEDKK